MDIAAYLADILMYAAGFITLLCVPVFLWQGVVNLFGFFAGKKKGLVGKGTNTPEKTVFPGEPCRFAVVACARNEEAVIGQLLDSLRRQRYPRDRFSLFVVADNCTDGTAEAARSHGAFVLERFNRQQVGKGHALRWAFPRILKEAPDCDAVVLFDADNEAEPDFLDRMDQALRSGADVAQGYRVASNPGDSWVSGCYAVYWRYMSRFFNRSRARMGNSCLVGGTGFAFRRELLEKDGWNTRTLSEDTEFSIQHICRGRRIVPVDDAVFYDEQPVSFRVSLRQRFRWMTGSLQCASRLLPDACQALGRGGRQAFAAWDVLMLLLLPLAVVLSTVAGTASVLTLLFSGQFDQLTMPLLSGVVSVLSLMVMAAVTLRLEGDRVRPLWKSVVLFPLFVIPVSWLLVVALIRPGRDWKPIVHTGRRAAKEEAPANLS